MKQNNPIIKILSGILVFGFTAIFSAVFFGSIDYIGTVSAADSDLNVSITPNVALSIVDNNGVENLVSLNITPNATGVFSSASTNVIASTTNETGYTITMSDVDNDTNLVHEDTTITTNNTIPTLASQTNESSFPTNYYGYSFNNTTITGTTDLAYLPIPSLSTPTTLITTDSQGNATYPFTIATKVDTSIPAGTYKDTITFSITANYVPTSPLSQIANMQDMSPEICAASTVGDEAILTDARDNNTYTVRKMEDGKCWMTQNLRLGSTSSAVTLTPADSDVTSNFTIPTSAVRASGTLDWRNGDMSTSGSSAWDVIHVYNNGDSWVQPTSPDNNATVNTTGTPDAQSKYIGNYYNWYTATAGTGTYSMANGEATGSICPKGWKLPTAGSTTANFNSLTQALVGANTNTSFVPDKSFAMQSAPNYFVLSGYYNGGVYYQGSRGHWWSRTAYSSTGAHYLYLATTSVHPQSSIYLKYEGLSVRCVAQ